MKRWPYKLTLNQNNKNLYYSTNIQLKDLILS